MKAAQTPSPFWHLEQSKILAELEADGKLHVPVYCSKSLKFIEAQDKVIEELYPSAKVQAGEENRVNRENAGNIKPTRQRRENKC